MKRLPGKLILALSMFSMTLVLSGCTNAILFSTSSMIGIDIQAVEQGQQTIKVGYNRFEGVIMPVMEKERKETDSWWRRLWYPRFTKPMKEAFPVFARFEMDTGSLLLPDLKAVVITEVFATGKAAEIAAKPAAPAADAAAALKAAAVGPPRAALDTLFEDLAGSSDD